MLPKLLGIASFNPVPRCRLYVRECVKELVVNDHFCLYHQALSVADLDNRFAWVCNVNVMCSRLHGVKVGGFWWFASPGMKKPPVREAEG